MTQTERKFETVSNVTRTDRMRLTSGPHTYTADVVSADGEFLRIDAGQIVDTETGMQKGSFNTSNATSVSLGISATASRQERTEVYEAVETFLALAIEETKGYRTISDATEAERPSDLPCPGAGIIKAPGLLVVSDHILTNATHRTAGG